VCPPGGSVTRNGCFSPILASLGTSGTDAVEAPGQNSQSVMPKGAALQWSSVDHPMSSNAQLALTGRNEREYLTQSHPARDPTPHPCRRCVPRRSISAQSGCGQAAPHRRSQQARHARWAPAEAIRKAMGGRTFPRTGSVAAPDPRPMGVLPFGQLACLIILFRRF
jgi:hypothetical protein